MEPNYGYKHTRGFITFLIIIFCGWVVVAHSQVSSTGNLVGNTWNNGYSVPELTCWGDARGSVNCSPGGTPYVRPGGAINFSYSFTELYQSRAMADVLPYSGSGLMVTGFQFNWMSKNGNSWDDARQDQLSAYVQMYSKGGQWIEAQSYNLNYKHDWTNFSWTGTFSKERRGDDLGTILYGFAGKDNNYWLGPYGPEIMNVSFSLRYQPDPCVVNPLHSTDCPGFLKAIASPAYQAQESSAAIAPIVAVTTGTAQSITLPTMASAVLKLTSRQEQFAQETEAATSRPTNSINSSASAMMNQVATPVTVARVRTSLTDVTDSAVARDIVLEQTPVAQTTTTSTLAQNINSQTRLNQVRDTSTRSDAASETVTLDQPLMAMPQTTNTTTVATVLTLPIQPRSTAQTVTTDNDTSAQTQISLFRVPEPVVISQPDTQTNYSLVEPARINTDPQPVSAPVQALAALSQPAPVLETVTMAEPVRAPAVEIPAADIQSSTVAALIDRTNPLNNIFAEQPVINPTASVFTGPSVKSNTQDNDIASGVNISQIARVLVGFDVYQNLAIREIAFYQPREIYRGQRTVDNVRALRNLGQDAKHQQMIDQQYGR
jgi:hypothetical protein